jgi:hypothetical protein
MKKYLRSLPIILFFLFAPQLFSQNTPVFAWQENLHDVQGRIVVEASGNIIMAGTFTGTPDFDPGPGVFTLTASGTDVYIAKFSSSGNFIWACQTHSYCPLMNSHKVDAFGNIYSTGCIASTSFDTFIWKVDASGNSVWLKVMGGSYADNGIDIDVDAFGNVYSTGVFSSVDTDFDPGPGTYTMAGTDDGYISKLDANGNFIWAKAITSTTNVPYSCVPWGIVVDNANAVYICGQFEDIIDLDPSAAVYTLTTNAAAHDGFVAKYDTAGNFAWAGSFQTPNEDAARKLIKATNGIYLAGYFNGIVDLDPSASNYTLNSSGGENYLLKINSAGNLQWAKQAYFGTWGLEIDNDFSFYIIGGFYTPTDFDPGPGSFSLAPTNTNTANAFLCKLDSSGLFKWAVQLQDTGYSGMYSVALNNVGDIYMSGFYTGRVDFDPAATSYTSSSLNDFDSFLLKFALGTVHIPEIKRNDRFAIYPNPVSRKLFIKAVNGDENLLTVEIVDVLGEKISETKLSGNSIDLEDLAPGVYYVCVRNKNTSEVKKIIVR